MYYNVYVDVFIWNSFWQSRRRFRMDGVRETTTNESKLCRNCICNGCVCNKLRNVISMYTIEFLCYCGHCASFQYTFIESYVGMQSILVYHCHKMKCVIEMLVRVLPRHTIQVNILAILCLVDWNLSSNMCGLTVCVKSICVLLLNQSYFINLRTTCRGGDFCYSKITIVGNHVCQKIESLPVSVG